MERPELYFIAIVPGPDLREKVKKLKEEMKLNYKAGHALKSPAHITLQMPFKREAKAEAEMSKELKSFAAQQKPFQVDLSGFGAFRPRVMFIKVVEPEPIIKLHAGLRGLLSDKLDFSKEELMQTVQPHMTIATRDLEKEMFFNAWPHFENRDFEDSFRVSSLFLLKHNGRNWDLFREFSFGRDQ